MTPRIIICDSAYASGSEWSIATRLISVEIFEFNPFVDVIEPYLMQQGLVQRTSRGRILSEKGHNHIKLFS